MILRRAHENPKFITNSDGGVGSWSTLFAAGFSGGSVLCLTPGASTRMEAIFWMPVGVRELENNVRREPQTSKWLKQTQSMEQNALTPSNKSSEVWPASS